MNGHGQHPGAIIRAEGHLFPGVEGIASTGGVAMNPPPVHLLPQISTLVATAMSSIPEGERVKLVTVLHRNEQTGKVSGNVVAAVKAGDHVNIVGWFGKSWGTPVAAGVMAEVHF